MKFFIQQKDHYKNFNYEKLIFIQRINEPANSEMTE